MYTVGDRTAAARHITIKIIRGLCEYSKYSDNGGGDFLMRRNNARRRIIIVYVGFADGSE